MPYPEDTRPAACGTGLPRFGRRGRPDGGARDAGMLLEVPVEPRLPHRRCHSARRGGVRHRVSVGPSAPLIALTTHFAGSRAAASARTSTARARSKVCLPGGFRLRSMVATVISKIATFETHETRMSPQTVPGGRDSRRGLELVSALRCANDHVCIGRFHGGIAHSGAAVTGDVGWRSRVRSTTMGCDVDNSA